MIDVVLKNSKLTTIGGSRGFIVPAAYIKNGLVLDGIDYEVIIRGIPGQMIRKKPLKPEVLTEIFDIKEEDKKGEAYKWKKKKLAKQP